MTTSEAWDHFARVIRGANELFIGESCCGYCRQASRVTIIGLDAGIKDPRIRVSRERAMKCLKCESDDLVLAPLWPLERREYPKVGIVMRRCMDCGLEQNHMALDETLTPEEAAERAPTARKFPGMVAVRRDEY